MTHAEQAAETLAEALALPKDNGLSPQMIEDARTFALVSIAENLEKLVAMFESDREALITTFPPADERED